MLIAEDRAGRPSDFEAGESTPPTAASSCPFCVGHENETPDPLWEVNGEDDNWQVRVIPNLYPAVSADYREAWQQCGSQDSTSLPAYGAHEVIIESPRHVQDIDELTVDELARVLLVYRDRLHHWSQDKSIRHATLFKNVGYAAGASLEHIHSQLVAIPFVPEVITREMQGAKQFFDQEGECIFCQMLQKEIEQEERLVCSSEGFVAFCAYAGRQPFETWILPTSHELHFHSLTDSEAHSLASLLQQLVSRLQTQLKPLSYNLLLHTAPFDEQRGSAYHWHLEIVPRTAQLAGLEWGAGVHINPVSPETAARRLREAFI